MTKRLIDVGLGALLLVLAFPVMIVVAVVVRLGLGSPVLFTQVRPGLHGRPFRLIKFRTMSDARDSQGELLPDAQRLGQVGTFLRRFSLDELPELINVLRGEMSLVGPRPLLMEYLPLYDEVQSRRHEVKPGLTGMAQVYGRNAISWNEKFVLDVWYVDNRSLLLDLKLILFTLWRVFRPEGVTMNGHATMPPFAGNDRG